MKTTEGKCEEIAKRIGGDSNMRAQLETAADRAFKKAQEFIPIEEEKPPYREDILVQTPAGSIYFGKIHEGMNGKPDYFWPDLAAPEEILKIQQLKSWRPIFYE